MIRTVCFVLFLFLCSGLFGRIYYVSPNGQDGDAGTEISPLRSIQNAVNGLRTGDSVVLMPGVYSERVVVKKSGNSGTPLVIRGLPGCVIDGRNIDLPEDSGLFDLSGSRSVIVTGITLVNSRKAGFYAERSSGLVLKGNTVSNTYSSGIGIWYSKNVVMESNEVILACNGGQQECITVAGTDGFDVRYNLVRNGSPDAKNGGEGIDAKDGSRNGRINGNTVRDLPKKLGIYVDAWDKRTGNIDVFANRVSRCTTGFALASEAGGLLENVRLFNNLAFDNDTCGIVIAGWGEPAPRRPMKNIGIYHNTCWMNGRDWGVGIAIANKDALSISVINNIFSENRFAPVEFEEGVPKEYSYFSHNLFFGPNSETGKNPGTFAVEDDPKFLDPDNGDFRLGKNSPAIDRGLPVSFIPKDFSGQKRVRGRNPDLGAWESGN